MGDTKIIRKLTNAHSCLNLLRGGGGVCSSNTRINITTSREYSYLED